MLERCLAASPPVTSPRAEAPHPLPVSRVVLHGNAVALVERRLRVVGRAEVRLPVKPSQMDDALKSLVILDLGRGRIGAVGKARRFRQRHGSARSPSAWSLPPRARAGLAACPRCSAGFSEQRSPAHRAACARTSRPSGTGVTPGSSWPLAGAGRRPGGPARGPARGPPSVRGAAPDAGGGGGRRRSRARGRAAAVTTRGPARDSPAVVPTRAPGARRRGSPT